MRSACCVVAVMVAVIAGSAAPAHAQKTIQEHEIEKLEKELTDLQIKQATFAAVKVARKLYEAQRKITGEESIETQRRKQTLASAMQAAGDHAGSIKLYTDCLLYTSDAADE